MIKGFAHVCIVTPDLEATQRFYCSVLGVKKSFDFVRGNQVVGFYLELPGRTFIEVFRQEAVEDHAGYPIRHFCLEVDDLDETIRRLKAHGHEITDKTLGADHSWQAWTRDPSGVRIEFHQYTETSTQLTGANCILK